jgi:hypothetical protein
VKQFIVGYWNKTFRGNITVNGGPSSLQHLAPLFAPYMSKIHFCNLDRPGDSFPNHWDKESTGRDRLIDALRDVGAGDGDYVVYSDLDEFITRSAWRRVAEDLPAVGQQFRMAQYYFNFRHRRPWAREENVPFIMRISALNGSMHAHRLPPGRVEPLRWDGVMAIHCSYCFPNLSRVIHKLRTFSHDEFEAGHFVEPAYRYAMTACGVNPFNAELSTYVPRNDAIREVDLDIPDDPHFEFLFDVVGYGDLDGFEPSRGQVMRHASRRCQRVLPSDERPGRIRDFAGGGQREMTWSRSRRGWRLGLWRLLSALD